MPMDMKNYTDQNTAPADPDIASMSLEEIREVFRGRNIPTYRAGQLFRWIHAEGENDYDKMSDLPAGLRADLAKDYPLPEMTVLQRQVSKLDGTQKFLFSFSDGETVESVFMKYSFGNSVCISSQSGCRMGCRFCASTLDGLKRNLTASEMLGQIYRIRRLTGEKISHVVVMGTGEPLDNYDQLLRFIRLLTGEGGMHLGQRNLTVSTCGIVPNIRRLAEEKLQITLAVSLHEALQKKREEIMPIAKKYELGEVLAACRQYYQRTGRRISFEYSVVKGVNDSPEEAKALAELLGGFAKGHRGGREGAFHVNLIPVNPIEERNYESPDPAALNRFRAVLENHGINVTVRREMGRDIHSACGQLRRRYSRHAGTGTD